MESTIRIRIAAAPEHVFALCRQVPRWAELLPHYRSVTVHRQARERMVARMVAVRRFGPLPVPVAWRAEHWTESSDPADLRLRFRHLRGVTKGMDVTWHIRPLDGGAASAVSIVHRFHPRVPLLGEQVLPLVIDRLFVRPIAGRTLRTFRMLAERGDLAHEPAR